MTARTREPVLSVRGLSVVYHTRGRVVAAVDDASFDIRAGETLALVGESGSGKTATALAVLGLLPRSARIRGGAVEFCGRDLLKLPQHERRKLRGREIAMIFQNPTSSFNPVLTIGTQLREPLREHLSLSSSAATERVVSTLASVGVTEPVRRLKQFPHQLSGGMNQRAMIAMALLCEPKLLIADEPTTALDVTIQAQVVELMRALKGELSTAMLWISHDMGVVAGIADYVAVMYAGRIVEVGAVEDVYLEPRHPYTAALLSSLPRLDRPRQERLKVVEGEPPAARARTRGCVFAPRCPLAITACDAADPPLRSVDGSTHRSACIRSDEVELRS